MNFQTDSEMKFQLIIKISIYPKVQLEFLHHFVSIAKLLRFYR